MAASTDTRSGTEVLDRDLCLELLAHHSGGVGRLAVVDERGIPRLFPVNYLLIGDQVVFRTADGTKLAAARARRAMSFEIDQIDDRNRSGWSVVVTGTSEIVEGESQRHLLLASGLVPFAAGAKDAWVFIHEDEITGRRVAAVQDWWW